MDEKYFDVLQNIEFAIVRVYQNQNDLKDYEVMNASDTLINAYRIKIR